MVHHELEVSMVYLVNSKPAWATEGPHLWENNKQMTLLSENWRFGSFSLG